jgi:hypothetical protein
VPLRHSISLQRWIGRARNCTAVLQTYSAVPTQPRNTLFRAVARLCRYTPREMAADEGAFDAAVNVRRTAAV